MKKGTGFALVVAIFSSSLGMLSSASALAGGMEGGGGKTVVCRNPDGSIRSAEILDLYEGRTVYQLPYRESSDDWQTQVTNILTASGLGTAVTMPRSTVYGWYQNAIEHLTFLPDGTSLKPIDDSLEAVIPDGCALEQTVNYQNDNLILVNGQIWKALSQTQKASLLIHESVYRLLRGVGETDSRRARHFTAYVVSGHVIEDVFPGNNYQLICSGGPDGKTTTFYAVLLPTNSSGAPQQVRLQFWSFGGRKIMSRAYVDLDLTSHNPPGGPAPDTNLLEQLKHPTQWMRMQSLQTSSLFEPGDTFDLWFHPDSNGKWLVQLLGTSIVDDAPIATADLNCIGM